MRCGELGREGMGDTGCLAANGSRKEKLTMPDKWSKCHKDDNKPHPLH